jgi:Arc/MetJ family transcription regulator
MHRKGLSSSAVFAALKEHNKEFCIPPLSDDELRKISDSISNYKRPGNSDIEFDRFFNPKKTIRNSVVFLEQKYGNSIWFNEFSGCEFIGDKPVSDLTVTEISEWLMFEKHIELPDNAIDKAIKILALRTKRNPVADYLSSLVWDGKERVKTIFSNYMNTEDTILQRRAAGMFLVSAVARIFDPGCKYDHMIILMSKQGTGKQRLLETLAGKWYGSVRFKDRDKETVQKMLGRWFIEVGEMRGMGTKEINDIKDFVTTRVDRERFAYGRKLGEYPRTNIFVGSWNPDHVGLLNDKTGNRRFIPIEIGKIDIEGIKEVRDQLFAESVHMYKDGYRLYLDDDEDAQFITELNNIHKKVEVKEEWANHIVTFMQSSKAFDIPNEVTILDVFCAIFPNKTAYDLDYNSSRRIGSALAQLGCDTLGNKTKLGITAKYFDVSKLRVKNGDFSSKYDVLMAVLMEKTGFSTENINDIINNKMLENVNKSKDWEE